MIVKSVTVLLTFIVTCNAFWFGTQQQQLQQAQQAQQAQQVQQAQQLEQQNAYRQIPVSYFRTYTYPITFPQQAYSPLQQYQITNRLYQTPMSVNWQRQFQTPVAASYMAASSQSSQTLQPQSQIQPAQPQPQPQQPQQPQQLPASLQTPQPSPPPQQQSQQLSQQSQVQPQSPPSGPTGPSFISSPPTGPQFGPLEFQQQFQPQAMPPQQAAHHHQFSQPHMKPSYLQDPVNLQYITNVAPLNVQHVQFVPCMCPVTVSLGSPEMADKRSDEMVTSSESNEAVTIGLSTDDNKM